MGSLIPADAANLGELKIGLESISSSTKSIARSSDRVDSIASNQNEKPIKSGNFRETSQQATEIA